MQFPRSLSMLRRNITLFLSATPVAAVSLPAWADFTGKVVAVADGDTITVLRDREQIKVRLVWADVEPVPPWEWRHR